MLKRVKSNNYSILINSLSISYLIVSICIYSNFNTFNLTKI